MSSTNSTSKLHIVVFDFEVRTCFYRCLGHLTSTSVSLFMEINCMHHILERLVWLAAVHFILKYFLASE